jgi:hypothetical protein
MKAQPNGWAFMVSADRTLIGIRKRVMVLYYALIETSEVFLHGECELPRAVIDFGVDPDL